MKCLGFEGHVFKGQSNRRQLLFCTIIMWSLQCHILTL